MDARTSLTQLLGMRHPVLLAPMAGVSGGQLAAGVSRAGGLGLIGGGYGDSAWLAEQLALCSDVPFGVGFITWALREQPFLLQQALDARPRAVMLSFGTVDELAAPILAAGAVLIAQVQTVQQARQAVAHGAQIVVAQGGEAGGHGGLRGTMALVPAVVDAVGAVPVVAAGGIADGRGLAAALVLGAGGALCGTAFVAACESLAPLQVRQRLLQGSGDDTVRSPAVDLARGLHWPDGPWQLRSLRNPFIERRAQDLPGLQASMPDMQRQYAAAREAGDFDVVATIVGEAADLVRAVAPAADIVRAMVAHCDALLSPQRTPSSATR